MDVFTGVPVAFSRANQAAPLPSRVSAVGAQVRCGAKGWYCHPDPTSPVRTVSQRCLHFTGQVFTLVIYKNMPPPKSGRRPGHGQWERSADVFHHSVPPWLLPHFLSSLSCDVLCTLDSSVVLPNFRSLSHLCDSQFSIESLGSFPCPSQTSALCSLPIYCPPACVLLPEVHSSSCRRNMWHQQQVTSYLKMLKAFNMTLSHW